jgi:S1-C subfamily serine protease
VDNDLALSLGLDRPLGALVTVVESGSPADAAGLRQGDLLLAIDGAQILNPDAFGYFFSTKGVSGKVELTILRRGRERRLSLNLREIPAERLISESALIAGSPLAGAKIEAINRQNTRKYKLVAQEGVVVVEVERGSPAERVVGLRAGDVILSVNDARIVDLQSITSATSQRSRSWQIVTQRGRSILRQFYRG